MMPRVLLLFDIDGTLLLSGGAGSRALDQAFHQEFGLEEAMAGVAVGGRTDPAILKEVFRTKLRREATGEELTRVLDAYLPLLGETLQASDNYRLMPHVPSVLKQLGEGGGHCMCIATGNIRAAANAKLARGGLEKHFVAGGYGCDAEDRGELVSIAIERGRAAGKAHYDASEVVVIGDTDKDVAAAKANGVRCVAVRTGVVSEPGVLEKAGADVVLDTLEGFIPWLESVQ